MEKEELIKRARELLGRSMKTGRGEVTGFLTPAEQMWLKNSLRSEEKERMMLWGGYSGAERCLAVFRPDYVDAEAVDLTEFLCAVKAVTKFGSPTHRDYLGSLMGMGIKREAVGDIIVDGETAWFFCLPTVADHVVMSMEHVGRCGVKLAKIEPHEVPEPEVKVKNVHFTVKSMRLDAVASEMFNVSRSEMSRLIGLGSISLNYEECLKPDARVDEGDIISVRGKGKGKVISAQGLTKKGRIPVEGEIRM